MNGPTFPERTREGQRVLGLFVQVRPQALEVPAEPASIA
jgi:hypothetical protein